MDRVVHQTFRHATTAHGAILPSPRMSASSYCPFPEGLLRHAIGGRNKRARSLLVVALICERTDKKVARVTKHKAIVLERRHCGHTEGRFKVRRRGARFHTSGESSEDFDAAPSRATDKVWPLFHAVLGSRPWRDRKMQLLIAHWIVCHQCHSKHPPARSLVVLFAFHLLVCFRKSSGHMAILVNSRLSL